MEEKSYWDIPWAETDPPEPKRSCLLDSLARNIIHMPTHRPGHSLGPQGSWSSHRPGKGWGPFLHCSLVSWKERGFGVMQTELMVFGKLR